MAEVGRRTGGQTGAVVEEGVLAGIAGGDALVAAGVGEGKRVAGAGRDAGTGQVVREEGSRARSYANAVERVLAVVAVVLAAEGGVACCGVARTGLDACLGVVVSIEGLA